MTTLAATIATAAPALIPSPSIAADEGRPVQLGDAGLFDLWERRKAMIAETRAMWTKYQAIDPSGHTYEDHAGPVLEVVWAMERQISELAPSVDKAAAMLMMALADIAQTASTTIEDCREDGVLDVIIRSLEALLPTLRGPIAQDAKDLFAMPGRPICEAPFVG